MTSIKTPDYEVSCNSCHGRDDVKEIDFFVYNSRMCSGVFLCKACRKELMEVLSKDMEENEGERKENKK